MKSLSGLFFFVRLRCLLVWLLLIGSSLEAGRAAAVSFTNYEEAVPAQVPLSLSNGSGLLQGGTVQLGSFFGGDPGGLFNEPVSPAVLLAALVSDFVPFGVPSVIGEFVPGLYEAVAQAPLNNGNVLIGKPIYTLIGDGATLATSSEFAVIRHNVMFGVDNPFFNVRLGLFDPGNVLLWGRPDGPQMETALGSAVSLQLAPFREREVLDPLGVEGGLGEEIDGGTEQFFGVVPPGTAVGRDFRVRNLGTTLMTGLAVELDGFYASSFGVDRTQLPSVLAPGESGTFTVTFDPVTSGTKNAMVTLLGSAPGQTVFLLPVSGVGDSYFAAHPVARTVAAGQSVTFTAVAQTFDGSAPAYQWFRNGAAVAGATGATYTVPSAQPWHAGGYAVQVMGSSGPIFSQTAGLRLADVSYGPWQGLVSYYPFDGSPADLVRAARPAELINDTRLVTDEEEAGVVEVVGRGFAIPPFPSEPAGSVGPGGYVRIPRPVEAAGEPFTVSFWLKEQGYSNRHGEAFLTLGEGFGAPGILGHYWIGGSEVQPDYYGSEREVVELASPGSATIDASGVVVMDSPWTAWTLVGRDGMIRVYRQGIYRGSLRYPASVPGDFYIGRHWWFDGGLRYSTRLRARLNEMRVFDRALTDADVEQLFSSQTVPEPGDFQRWSGSQGLVGAAAEPGADPDRDGFTNMEEYSFGTVPTQATPALSSFRLTADSSVLDWLARPDVRYGAYSSLDLVRWVPALFPITAAPDQGEVPEGYQRLQLELPLLNPLERIKLYVVRIEAEAPPVFVGDGLVVATPPTGEVVPGESVTLSGPEASNALSYQWYWNEMPLAGATDRTLVLPSVTANQAGSYYLVAVNAQGQTRSLPQFLAVRPPLPALATTGVVTNVTGRSALASGVVSSDGGAVIRACGVVFSRIPDPTLVTDPAAPATPATGSFAAPLSGLQGKTTYYVRAYASTATGTTYGDSVAFMTEASTPSVLTGAAVAGGDVGTFTVSGSVSADGGSPVTARGVVYGLAPAPTLATAGVAAAGSGTGSFSSVLTNLVLNVPYYARVYASNALGTGYGAEITFTAVGTPSGFSLIPAGSFQMGDGLDNLGDAPLSQVTVSAFYLAQRETTKAEWDEVRAWGLTRGYVDLPAGGGKAANHPVQGVTWFDVVKWCNARSEKEGLEPCYRVGGSPMLTGVATPEVNWTATGYRLPTEAEWEKAARGGLNGKRFPWGDTISHSQANYESSSVYAYDTSPTRGFHPTYAVGNQPYTSPAGSFAANGYGLYNMAGNVFEWCWDWHGTYASSPQTDPKGSASGSVRVFRGGAWDHSADYARVAARAYIFPGNQYNFLGFRVARRSVP